MRCHLLVLLIATCGVFAEEHTFTARPIKPGDQKIVIRKTSVEHSGKLKERDEKFAGSWSTVEEIFEKVLAAEDGRSSKIHVKFERTEFSKSGSPMVTEPHLDEKLSGKSFVVERVDGKIKIVSLDDNRPDRSTTDDLAARYRYLLHAGAIAKWLNGKTLATGDKLEMPADCVREMFASDMNPNVTMKVKEFREHNGERCAVFELKGKFSSSDSMPDKSEAELKGNLLLGIETCRPVQIDLECDYKVSRSYVEGMETGKAKWLIETTRK
jgi:hypothetical protein